MRAVVILFLLASTAANADATAPRDLVEYKQLASAAAGDNCEAVRELGRHVQALDPRYYANDFATDPAIARCLATASTSTEVPLTTAGLLGQFVVGGLGSIVGGFGGLILADKLCDDGGNPDACFGPALMGIFIGGSLGFGVGVYFGGSLGAQTGSFVTTMLGAALGSAIPFLAAQVSDQSAASAVLLVAPMVGALVGFNATRRWKRRDGVAVGSLLRQDGGQVSLGIPLVTHAEQRGIATTTLPLFSGSF